jgi:tRNA A37 methylthiotransferase MiaB
MRRFGDGERFLELLAAVRARSPEAGVRSNVIVGFPARPRRRGRAGGVPRGGPARRGGVFGYSDEDGTEAAGFDGKLPEALVRERVERISQLVEELTAQRAEERIGQVVEVLVESVRRADRVRRGVARPPRGPRSTARRCSRVWPPSDRSWRRASPGATASTCGPPRSPTSAGRSAPPPR